jgi:hypothetical protein
MYKGAKSKGSQVRVSFRLGEQRRFPPASRIVLGMDNGVLGPNGLEGVFFGPIRGGCIINDADEPNRRTSGLKRSAGTVGIDAV